MTTYLGKSCSFCLPRVPFVNCRQFMYLVIDEIRPFVSLCLQSCKLFNMMNFVIFAPLFCIVFALHMNGSVISVKL